MKPRAHTVLVYALALACLSCALWRSAKAAAFPAIGGAVGAAVGLAFGPAGSAFGAALGAGISSTLEQNAALREGEILGRRAVEHESERAGRAPIPSAPPWYMNPGVWLASWLIWRNRAHLLAARSAGKGSRLQATLRGLWHAIYGGKAGK